MEDKYKVVKVESPFLHSLIAKLDYHLCEQEETIREQDEEIKRLRKEAGERVSADIKAGQDMSANILKSLLSTPSVSSIGPVGATVLSRIHDMSTIEQVHEYIKQIIEDNKEELDSLKKECSE